MVKLDWTTQAHDDLHAIFDHISHDSRSVAKIFVEKVYYRADQLRQFPFSGRVVPELERDDIRELIYRNYRIVYQVIDSDRIQVLTVFHSSKTLDETALPK